MVQLLGELVSQFVGRVCDWIGGLWVLFTLALISQFRFSSRYWVWRKQTAFPAQEGQNKPYPMIRLTLEYAQWAWRLRRLR